VLFQIASQPAVYNERVAIVLGLTTLFFALAAFLSCRSFISLMNRAGFNPARSHGFMTFFRYHTYYWWLFGAFLLAHVMIGTFHTASQFGGADAVSHGIIVGLGLFGAVSGVALFSSCRIYPRLMAHTLSRQSFASRTYQVFFSRHSYYWAAFALLIAGHFLAGFLHAGIWPVSTA
jgi:hypothetical protein